MAIQLTAAKKRIRELEKRSRSCTGPVSCCESRKIQQAVGLMTECIAAIMTQLEVLQGKIVWPA